MIPSDLSSRLVTDVESLGPIAQQWDALAVRIGRPYSGPVLALAWWRRVGSKLGDELRTVVVESEGRLVGILPMFVSRGSLGRAEYRFVGAGTFHRLGPLAEPGSEVAVAMHAARLLRDAAPRPSLVAMEGFAARSPWPGLLAEQWGSRTHLRADSLMPAPVVNLGTSYDEWLSAKSKNFRQQMGRRRRKLEKAGAGWRMSADAAEAAVDLQAMFRLHHARWAARGGSGALSHEVEQTLSDAAELADGGRMRLWMMEVDRRPAAAALFFAAGGEVTYWGGGLDPAWDAEAPGVQLLLREIEHACGNGDARLDLGGGDQPYKQRFADADDALAWRALYPLDARFPLTRAQLAPKHAFAGLRRLARGLPDPAQEILRRGRSCARELLARARPGRGH